MKYFLLILAFNGAYEAWAMDGNEARAMDGVRQTSKLPYHEALNAYKTIFSEKSDSDIKDIMSRHYNIIAGVHQELSAKLAEFRSQGLSDDDPKILACQKLLEVYPGMPKPDAASDPGDDSSSDNTEESAFESENETEDTVVDENT